MLIYYYEIPELVKQVTKKSIYHAKNTRDEQGNPLLNEISVGPEDEETIKTFIKEAAIELLGMIEPYTRTLADLETPLEGFEWDVTYDPGDGGLSNCVVFRMVETTTMPTTILNLMENAIGAGLVNYPVGQFLFHNKVDGMVYLNLFEKNKDHVLNYINRRSGLKRTPKLY